MLYCDRELIPNVVARIDGDANVHKCETAIKRREAFERLPLDVTARTKICVNCNRITL